MKILSNILTAAITILTLSLSLLSCESGSEPKGPILPDPIVNQGSLEDYQVMSTNFGLSMFHDIVTTSDEENTLISPYSLQSALLMTMHGTDGATFEEFQTALQTGSFLTDGLGVYTDELSVKLRPTGENTHFTSQNKVYFSPDRFNPNPMYQNELESYYNATFQDEDFKDEATVDIINQWVSDATDGKVEKVLEEIAADEVIFLINALVFTADWSLGFAPNATQDRIFTKSDGSSLSVPTMWSDDQRPFTIQDRYSAVDIPVKDGDYTVTFLIPSETSNLSDLVAGFDLDFYSAIYNQLQTERVQLTLPKFAIESSSDLKNILIARGMTSTFQNADLSKMGLFSGNTYLTRILHDVVVKIDEAGIEGAAVTTVGVGENSLPPAINFDSPFIFIVRHLETEIPIFIGKVGNPLG